MIVETDAARHAPVHVRNKTAVIIYDGILRQAFGVAQNPNRTLMTKHFALSSYTTRRTLYDNM